MADHFQYLAWLGPLALAAAGLTIVVGIVRKRKSFFDPALCMAIVLAVGALSWRWRHDGVEMLWQSTIARDPNCYLACKNLGYALLQTGQEDKALACFQKAVELDPDDAYAYFRLAGVFIQKGQLDEAIIQLQNVVELQPGLADAHVNLGYALAQKGQLDGAIRQYQEALRLKPDFAEASYNLVVVLGLKEAAAKQPTSSTKP